MAAALIGSLMLVGIVGIVGTVVTIAIVLVDLVNQYRARRMGVTGSVVEGARLRLPPILRTERHRAAPCPAAIGSTQTSRRPAPPRRHDRRAQLRVS